MTFNIDLKIVIALVLISGAFTLLTPLNESPVRMPLGLTMVLFLPGYALIAALFPGKDDLDGIERIALSFGLSIAVVALICLFLNYTSWGIRLLPVLVSLSVFTLGMVPIAIYRRRSLGENAFSISFKQMYAPLKHEMFTKQKTRADRMLSVILILLVLTTVLSVFYVAVSPKQGEKFTEFYILGNESMADNYDTQLESGESVDNIVGIVNHEYTTVNYSLEVRLENNSLPVSSTFQHISLNHNETWERPISVVPDDTGSDMKLEYLLYREDNMTEPYRELHLWINVTDADNVD